MNWDKKWIADRDAFPNERKNGMSYRQWLIGQALATVSDSSVTKMMDEMNINDDSELNAEETTDMFTSLIAGMSIEIADKIIELLADE